jgi:hypothetical protein
MKKRFWALSVLAVFLLAAGTVRAQSVDDKIKSLERELSQLKDQQIDLKKEATAQAAAMPTFSYRPGGGLNISAADQSWGVRLGYEFALDWMKLEGEDHLREGDGGFFLRRNRPQFTYYWDRGFYEFAAELDMDGDETGTKEALIQRACFRTRFEQLNPWLPTMQFGMDCSGAGSRYRSSEMTFELPTLDRNNGFNTGSHAGIGLTWGNLPAFGLPGNMQFNYYWVNHGMSRGDGLKDQSNKSDHVLMWNINPLSEVKNKWISGIGFSMFAFFGNIDDRTTANNGANSVRTFQLRSQEGSTRVVFWTSPTQGAGLHTFLEPSAQYKVGPYQLNFVAGFDRYNEDRNASFTPGQLVGRAQGTYWKLMNDLMIWSPKGFLTGAPGEAGTLGLGYSFEKSWVDCGSPGCDTANGGSVRRTTLRVNEGGLRYWLSPSISLHFVVKNYDVSNTPVATQVATGCSSRGATNSGKSCNFTDAVLRFYAVY